MKRPLIFIGILLLVFTSLITWMKVHLDYRSPGVWFYFATWLPSTTNQPGTVFYEHQDWKGEPRTTRLLRRMVKYARVHQEAHGGGESMFSGHYTTRDSSPYYSVTWKGWPTNGFGPTWEGQMWVPEGNVLRLLRDSGVVNDFEWLKQHYNSTPNALSKTTTNGEKWSWGTTLTWFLVFAQDAANDTPAHRWRTWMESGCK